MEHYVEIISDDALTLHFLHCKLDDLSTEAVTWKKWKKSDAVGSQIPDLSLIDVSRMSWSEAVRKVNECSGSEIVLWGGRGQLIGSPQLQKYFTVQDLFRFVPAAAEAQKAWEASKANELGSKTATYSKYQDTVPIPID